MNALNIPIVVVQIEQSFFPTVRYFQLHFYIPIYVVDLDTTLKIDNIVLLKLTKGSQL